MTRKRTYGLTRNPARPSLDWQLWYDFADWHGRNVYRRRLRFQARDRLIFAARIRRLIESIDAALAYYLPSDAAIECKEAQ